jgi:hypothetical protein
MYNKKPIVIIFAATCALLINFTAFSQSSQSQNAYNKTSINTITTAVPFLMISPDARAGGMGDAGAASTADANSIHWNAAKLAFVEKTMGLNISYTPWLKQLVPDIFLGNLSGYKKLGKNQAFSASLSYFSMGVINFTDINGNSIGQFNPNEFSVAGSYALKLSDEFSASLTGKYIYSNLTGGIVVENTIPSKPGQAVAADIAAFYRKEVRISKKKSYVSAGATICNIGNKISYTETGNRDFIPTNLRLGTSAKMEIDNYNTIEFMVDANKLLVPSPPVYAKDNNGNLLYNADGTPKIEQGKNPNVGVVEGMIQSFSDAPGGFDEELREITLSAGMEYWYDKQFAIRAGYFHENMTKGNRKYMTLGLGLKYNVFGFDFAYLVAMEQINPLANTLRFSLSFDFDSFSTQQKAE